MRKLRWAIDDFRQLISKRDLTNPEPWVPDDFEPVVIVHNRTGKKIRGTLLTASPSYIRLIINVDCKDFHIEGDPKFEGEQ